MRALGYLATRDSGEAPAVSLEQQRQGFDAYCLREDHRAVAVFEDRLSPTEEGRPAYQEMVEFVKNSSVGYLVVIIDTTVLGGTLQEVIPRVLEMDSLGSAVVCIDSQLPDPLQNALHLLQGTHPRRIRDAMTAKALEGLGLGKPPYGYGIGPAGRLEIVPPEAEVVQDIFHRYAEQGLGIRRVTQHLNDSGILTRNGGRWNTVAVLDVLKNPVYLGTYQRFGFRIPRNHPVIVSSPLFQQAQELMRARRVYRRRAQAQPFFLSGLVYCGFCGGRMIGVTRRQTWHRKDGTRRRGLYRYYQCQARTNQGQCDYHTHRAQELEEQVLAETRALLSASPPDAAPADALQAHEPPPDSTRGPAFPAEAKKAWQRRWLQTVRLAAQGGMSLGRLRAILDDLTQEQAAMDSFGTAELSLQERALLLDAEQWESLDFPQQQDLLRRLVQRVTVTEDDCQVLFHSMSSGTPSDR